MKSSILNHLDDEDRARMVQTLELTLDKLAASAKSSSGWVASGRESLAFSHQWYFPSEMQELRLTIDPDRTVLRHRFLANGKHRNCIIVEACDDIRPSRGETRENARIRVRKWLTEVEEGDDVGVMEDFRSRRSAAATALLAAACRRNDGWSSALATMDWSETEPGIMLGYPDDRRLALYCGSGEAPCDGTLSAELRAAMRSGSPRRHLVSTKSVTDPAPTFVFGPPPVIRIRSGEVSAIMRLTAIDDAVTRGLELIPHEACDFGQD